MKHSKMAMAKQLASEDASKFDVSTSKALLHIFAAWQFFGINDQNLIFNLEITNSLMEYFTSFP